MNTILAGADPSIVPPGAIRWESGGGVSEEAVNLRGVRRDAFFQEKQSRSIETYRRLDIWRRLENAFEEAVKPGWNAGEGEPVSRETRDEAEKFLLAIPESLWPTDVYPEPDGDITFEWYFSRDKLMIVSLDGKLRAIYVLRLPPQDKFAGKSVAVRAAGQEPFLGRISKTILDHLQRLFGDAR